jgi:RNA polymerase sigma-70 factor (ECF subfamily)
VRDDELAEVAAAWLAEARAAWPAIAVDAQTFVDDTRARLAPEATAADARALHAADLWLASACAAGDTAALAAFDDQYLSPLTGVLRATGLAADQIDDAVQDLRTRLLVGDGRPRILDYAGRADLRLWVRTAAVRAGIDLIRQRRDLPIEDEELAAMPAILDDPELAHLKDRYRDELRGAVSDAITGLPPRDRLLLRYTYVDGLTVDRVGAIYGVHRATAARWVSAARDTLAEATRAALVAKLGVTPSELRSIARLVESQIELSLRRLLD